ncbi:MAG: hypothetical protein IT380_24015 [Myxococcales bacterium]|nr:hypothetical protein [Myxococcales bacterium]
MNGQAHAGEPKAGQVAEEDVDVRVPGGHLSAVWFRPVAAQAVVVVALPSAPLHGRPGDRLSALMLAGAGFATLLVDLTSGLDDGARKRAEEDVPLLALRLAGAAHWLAAHGGVANLPVAYLGVDGAAAAALVATALDPTRVFGVVTRGGHPERAGASLLLAQVPTLFLFSAAHRVDPLTFAAARSSTDAEKRRQLKVLDSRTGELGEGEALQQVIAASTAWFTHWLDASAPARLALSGLTHRPLA